MYVDCKQEYSMLGTICVSIFHRGLWCFGRGVTSYALNSDGDVFCQGSVASLGDDNIPTDKLVLLSVGAEHSCAINTSQETICWGDDESGQSTPPQTTFVDVSAGEILFVV